MFNLFKTKAKPSKTEVQIIEEIHAAFDGAEDYLLKEAKKILSAPLAARGDMELVERAERLERIGFTQSEEVRKATDIRLLISEERKRKQMSQAAAELIEYYRQAYPFLKFLTEDEMERICDKYGLIFAPVSAYRGQVPEKNITDIEKAQDLKACDEAPNLFYFRITEFSRDAHPEFMAFFKDRVQTPCIIRSERDLREFLRDKLPAYALQAQWLFRIGQHEVVKRDGLFICAPPSDFNLDGLDRFKKGFLQTEVVTVKDPVVFRYVRGGIQVLTKWGLEASDQALTNPNDN